jgi:competence protein ComEC
MSLLFLFGLLRAGIAQPPPVPIIPEGGLQTVVGGVIVSDPEVRGTNVQFVLKTDALEMGEGLIDGSHLIQVSARASASLIEARREPYFRYGDRLRLQGRLASPPVFDTFDYRDYLARQGIHLTMAFPTIDLLAEGQGSWWREWVYSVRGRLSESLRNALPEPQASLSKALLLGQRGGFPPELSQDFRDTGTSHLLAISGLQVSMLLAVTLGLSSLIFGRRRQAYLLAPLTIIWAYALVSGMSPSAVRSAIMGSVFIAALATGRPRSILPSLALAAAVMAGLSPKVLRDISFQLSFTAVAGMALIGIPLTHTLLTRFEDNPSGQTLVAKALFATMSAIIISIAATIATLPLIAFNFHQIPFLGIPATVLSMPVQTAILISSFATAFAGLASSTLGQVVGWLAWLPLTYQIELVEFMAQAPNDVIAVPQFSGVLVWAYYGLLSAATLLHSYLKSLVLRIRAPSFPTLNLPRDSCAAGKIALTAGFVFFALIAWAKAETARDGLLHVTFLDVGQGDAIFIETPNGRQVLIDGGPDAFLTPRHLAGKLPFWDRSLDMVVVTHTDQDHLRGLVGVARRFSPGAVLEGKSDTTPLYLEWRQALEERGVEAAFVARGQTIDLDEALRLEVLHPVTHREHPQSNNNSVALRLVYGDISFLLPGDIEEEAEISLIESGAALDSTVLKVPHHGSRTSSSPAFLSAVSPAAAVVQASADNAFEHPHQDVMARLEAASPGQVYVTAKHGSIELTTDGQQLWVKTQR